MTLMRGDVYSIGHNRGTVSYQHYAGRSRVFCARLFFLLVALLFSRLHFVTVSSARVLVQEEAALAVLPGAGG